MAFRIRRNVKPRHKSLMACCGVWFEDLPNWIASDILDVTETDFTEWVGHRYAARKVASDNRSSVPSRLSSPSATDIPPSCRVRYQ